MIIYCFFHFYITFLVLFNLGTNMTDIKNYFETNIYERETLKGIPMTIKNVFSL